MKFEEWFKVEYPNQYVFKESTPTCKSFYDGASVVWDYKQTEIDAALKQRDSFIKAHHIAMNDVCDQKAEIDALQKRIDELEAKREGFVLVPKEPTEIQWVGLARHLGRYMQMHDRYCPKTLKKYLDRFVGELPEWLEEEVSDWKSEHAFATADLPVFIYKAMLSAVEGKD